MGFYERLVHVYGLASEDGTLDRTSKGYGRLQQEVMRAHRLAYKACNPDSDLDDGDLDMRYVTTVLPGGSRFSEDYRALLSEVLEQPRGLLTQLCESDWQDQMAKCLFLHACERHRCGGYFENEFDLKEHYITGRVIFDRLIEREGVAETLHLPGIEDRVTGLTKVA